MLTWCSRKLQSGVYEFHNEGQQDVGPNGPAGGEAVGRGSRDVETERRGWVA